MRSYAEKLIIKCERAIKDRNLDEARKLSHGISILTGQPAWKSAYDFLIDERDPEEEITYRTIDLPKWIEPYLEELHKLKGVEFKNQSARGGTQVPIEDFTALHDWLKEIVGSPIIGAWSTRLEKGGFHVNHIHPRGKNSGVLYVSIPDRSSGHLEFGATRFGDMRPKRTVIPRAGNIVSFPCWLWHGVSKYNGEKPRLTIAWDAE